LNYGIIVAAGKSNRVGANVDKAFLSLGNKPVLAYALQAYEKCLDIDGVILVVRKDRVEGARAMAAMFGCSKVKKVVAGGSKRQTSVSIGLSNIPDEANIISVHDGARPCVTPELISDSIKAAKRYGSGVAAVKVTDTVKHVEKGMIVSKTVDRAKLWAVQTPQTFKRDLLQTAFDTIKKKDIVVTDESQAVEMVSKGVHLVQSFPANIKITTADDLVLAASLLKL
jgi:2-C-methyl-D-erythritol 4-phosphate cytidylyltransferase